MPMIALTPRRSGRSVLPLVLGGLILLSAGCGADRYENRLQQTVEYFGYRAKLDENLNASWTGPGMQLRVPKGFEPVPPPQIPPGSESSSQQDAPQPTPGGSNPNALQHHPHFAPALPGLLGAWRDSVPVDDQEETQPAWLYAFSNHDLWLVQDAEEVAPQFSQDLLGQLIRSMNFSVPAPEDWDTQLVPPRNQRSYVERKQIETVTRGVEIEGKPYEMRLFLYEVGDIQAVLLWLVPAEAVSREQLWERMKLALQTWTVSGDRPRPEDERQADDLAF